MRPASGGSLLGQNEAGACIGRALHRERRAAATGAGGIGVFDYEPRADQFLGKVDDGIGKKGQGDAVDHNFLAGPFKDQVIVFGIIQRDVILKA